MTTQHKEPEAPSLFAALATALTSRTRAARRERLEVGLGVLCFFSLASVVSTLVAELTGHAALQEALVTLLFLVPTYLVYRMWRKAG
jgi:hypothetical protein